MPHNALDYLHLIKQKSPYVFSFHQNQCSNIGITSEHCGLLEFSFFFFFFSISRHRTIRSILKYNSCSLVYSIYVYMYRSATLCYSIHFSGFRFGRFFALPENGLATHLDCSCVRIFYVQFVNRVPICVSFVFSHFTSVCVVFFSLFDVVSVKLVTQVTLAQHELEVAIAIGECLSVKICWWRKWDRYYTYIHTGTNRHKIVWKKSRKNHHHTLEEPRTKNIGESHRKPFGWYGDFDSCRNQFYRCMTVRVWVFMACSC